MSVIEATEVHADDEPAQPLPIRRRNWLTSDLAVGLGYLAFAVFLTARLWVFLEERMVAKSGDQMFFMWVLSHGARVLTRGEYPFLSDQLNVPDGVNLMANTSALALTLPMAPVTLLFGPRVSFAALLVIGLAGTAFGWYRVFRRFVGSRAAAIVGGAFCGFAPGMVSHANGHVNWTAQLVVPFIFLAVLRLTRPDRTLVNGLVLGLLVVVQAFINEEVLLYTAMACGVFVVAYAAAAWRERREEMRAYAGRMLRGLGVAAVVAAAALAYPLYVQFFGPGSYQGVPGDASQLRADLASFWSFSRLSLAGGDESIPLALNITEENTFYGWPLLLVVAGAIVWLWHRVVTRALAATIVVFALFSLGPTLLASQRGLGIPLPWLLVRRIPPLDSVLPTRFGMVLIPLLGAVIALLIDRIGRLRDAKDAPEETFPLRRIAYLAVAAALLPIVPTPIPANEAPVTPAFITGGAWKEYVPAGHALVPVPDTSPGDPVAMVWLAESGGDFTLPGGYFIGPAANGRGVYGADPVRPTTKLLNEVAGTGYAPTVTDQMRQELRADLGYWRASALVMPDNVKHAQIVRHFVDQLTGRTGERVQDVTVWNTLDLAAGS